MMMVMMMMWLLKIKTKILIQNNNQCVWAIFSPISKKFQFFAGLFLEIITYMIWILRFIRRFWIRIRSTRVRSTYFQSGNANRRKFFEDDLHNLDHIVQWNNLLLAIFFMVVVFMIVEKESIGFTVTKRQSSSTKIKEFFFNLESKF